MSLIDQKFSQYLSSLEDQAAAGFLREVVFALPEDQRRVLIIKHCPEMTHAGADFLDSIDPEKREAAVHERHCNQGDYEGTCKYGDDNCPAIPEVKYDEPQERIWTVPVCRTGYGSRSIQVVAVTEEEAIEKAIDEAGGYEFSENDADYSAPDGAF